jgi:hypothetical protein
MRFDGSGEFVELNRAVIAVIIVLACICLTIGCLDSKKEQDFFVVRLTHDGSLLWMKVIDSGKDDELSDIVQTSDGGFVLAGGYSIALCNQDRHDPTTPRLIRLSKGGDILWGRDYSYGPQDGISSVFQTPDEGFTAISRKGMIWRLDSEGRILGTHTATPSDLINNTSQPETKQALDGCGARSPCAPTRDGGYIFISVLGKENAWNFQTVKRNPDGTQAWNRTFMTAPKLGWRGGEKITEIVQTSDGGYVMTGVITKTSVC